MRSPLKESDQPSGRRWLTPPTSFSPGPGREGPRVVGAPKMALDGSKTASEKIQEAPRWPQVATSSSIPPSWGTTASPARSSSVYFAASLIRSTRLGIIA